MITVLEVPQWDGSGSATARRLVPGAAFLASLVPADRHVRVPIGGTLAETAAQVRAALPDDGFPVVVGGDCGVDLAPVAAAASRYGDRLGVVWYDAHGDLNTPESSPSGAFHGMVLRTLLGDGPDPLVPAVPLWPAQVALVGTRALDPAESAFIRSAGIGSTPDPGAVVHVHVDLDVLDGIRSVGCPEPGGLTPEQLLAHVAGVAARHEIIGLTITEYAPESAVDEPMLRALVPALVRLCAGARARRIERIAASSWPAAETEERDGWLLRHTPGVGRRRSNSALPVGAPAVPSMEAFYDARQAPAVAQIAPADQHPELDALLESRGYALDGRTFVLTAPAVALTSDLEVTRHDDRASWEPLFAAITGDVSSMPVIARIDAPAAVFTVATAGLALAVTVDGWTGVFCMFTAPAHRRRGIATALLAAIGAWAPGPLYLQVEDGNTAARALYARAGFTLSHRYHYRTR
ncbi:GNAT family N-acetyltransferase [Catenuloplanes japonicus]|uniref:GNAT family N-acetyltransferase n=1 Tax=Catenuloplanes japonicus TaxID=33876 RepID=UPI00068EEA94|nr:GNAT family N-acetyltransferase [Catenuloplanes japonicus]